MRHPRLWWVAKSFTTFVKFHRGSYATNLLLKRTCASSSNRIVLRGRKENFAQFDMFRDLRSSFESNRFIVQRVSRTIRNFRRSAV